MAHYFLKFSGLIIPGLMFVGCTKFVADPDACYNDKVKQILVTNCTGSGCHNPQDKEEGYDFTNYNGVMEAVKPKHALQSELYTVLNGSGEGRMPPAYELSKEDKATIKNWINNGALNNSCTQAICDTTVFTYTAVNLIIQRNCVGCHNATNASGGVMLHNYPSVVACANNNTKLLGSVKHESGYSPMPKYSAKLSSCDIRLIEKWIEAGTPEN